MVWVVGVGVWMVAGDATKKSSGLLGQKKEAGEGLEARRVSGRGGLYKTVEVVVLRCNVERSKSMHAGRRLSVKPQS